MTQKSITQIHWHPDSADIFLALTVEALVLFKCDESYVEIETTYFKELEIREKLLDFYFCANLGTEDTLAFAVGDSGKTYMLFVYYDDL